MCIFPSATNCAEVQNRGFRRSGIYFLHTGIRILKVLCDLSTRGGGWMVSNSTGTNVKHGVSHMCACVCACAGVYVRTCLHTCVSKSINDGHNEYIIIIVFRLFKIYLYRCKIYYK